MFPSPSFSLTLGDARRPFPRDIEMRSGHLGILTTKQGVVLSSKVNDNSADPTARVPITGNYKSLL